MDDTKKISMLISAIVLPLSVTIIIPAVLFAFTFKKFSWDLGFPLILLPVIVGLLFVIAGIYLLVVTNRLFYSIGRGTLAPWDPPQKIVIEGPYEYIRNPMIGAVLLILLGETIIAGSLIIFCWFILFLIGNIIYFIYAEEPALFKRFGDEYKNYRKSVPMFIPKFRKKR